MTVLATLFTMKGCDHCDKMKPIWKTFADNNKDLVKEVECSKETDVCIAQGIRHFPTLIFSKSNEPDFKLEHVGPRTANALQNTLDILKN